MLVVELFNICYNIPNLYQKNDILGVLKSFRCEEQEAVQIGEYVEENYAGTGIAIKTLVTAFSFCSLKNSTKMIEFETFKSKI
jgi:hypothetical protein